MNWLGRWLTSGVPSAQLDTMIAEVRMQQNEMMKMLAAINQSIAKLVLQHAQQPEELTNEQRAALLGLPPSMSELVDWDQITRGRR